MTITAINQIMYKEIYLLAKTNKLDISIFPSDPSTNIFAHPEHVNQSDEWKNSKNPQFTFYFFFPDGCTEGTSS